MIWALDAWAVIAYLDGIEPAATRVGNLLRRSQPVMSWINLGEVHYTTARGAGTTEAETVVRDLRPLLTLDAPSPDRVIAAARVKAAHRMSYADAFAAATALAHDATLLTGDPELLNPEAPWRHEDLRG